MIDLSKLDVYEVKKINIGDLRFQYLVAKFFKAMERQSQRNRKQCKQSRDAIKKLILIMRLTLKENGKANL